MENLIPSKALIEATKTFLLAQAYADALRPVIKGLQIEVLNQYQFIDTFENTVITDPKLSYCMSDADADIYFKAMHEKYLAAGYPVEFGYCPLLIAENLQNDAEREFIKASQSLQSVINVNDLYYSIADLKKYVVLTVSYVKQYIKA